MDTENMNQPNEDELANAEHPENAVSAEAAKAYEALAARRRSDAAKQRRYRRKKKVATEVAAEASAVAESWRWNDPTELSEREILEIWRAECSEWHACMEGAIANAIWLTKQAGLVFNRFVATHGRHEAIRARTAEQNGEPYTPQESNLNLPENHNA
jgi:hypothetical protein